MSYLHAEYADAAALSRTIHELRARQVRRIEAYLPYPVPDVERALAASASRLSYVVFASGIGAAIAAYALQWLLQARLYPLDVGNRPSHFPLAFVPITFEMGVLFAAIAAVLAVFVGGRLLRLWYPTSDVEGFESATGTRFWLEVSGLDHEDEIAMVTRVMREGGALSVQRMEVV